MKTKEQVMHELRMSPNEFKEHLKAREVQFKDTYSEAEIQKINGLVRLKPNGNGQAIAPSAAPKPSGKLANLVGVQQEIVSDADKVGKVLARNKWSSVAVSFVNEEEKLASGFVDLIKKPGAELQSGDVQYQIDEEELDVADFFGQLYEASAPVTQSIELHSDSSGSAA